MTSYNSDLDSILNLRKKYPQITNDVSYLDNAATALTPFEVNSSNLNFYNQYKANIHRGEYPWSIKATDAYEESRWVVHDFIGAHNPFEIVFTNNCTTALNLVVKILTDNYLHEGDKILLTEMDHHSLIVPWHIAKKAKNLTLEFVNLKEDGSLDEQDFKKKVKDCKVVNLTQTSNVLGCNIPLKKLTTIAKKAGALTVVDGCQGIPHIPINVKDYPIDFYCFSGHKLGSLFGVGVLYINCALETLFKINQPPIGGGGAIEDVSKEDVVYSELPFLLEVGTPSIDAVISLSQTIKFLNEVSFEMIRNRDKDLLDALKDRLSSIKSIEFLGSLDIRDIPIVSFRLKNISVIDTCKELAERGVYVRGGCHCAGLIWKAFGFKEGSVRASAYFYNTIKDIDNLYNAIQEIVL